MADRRPRGPLSPPSPLLEVDAEYARLAMLLDSHAAFATAVATVPEAVGSDVAFIGVPDDDEHIVLRHGARAYTGALDGLLVPAGWGLAGAVLRSLGPRWVEDYRTAQTIAHIDRIDSSVAAEGLRAILAVPILHQERVLGVLYAARRSATSFGDAAIESLLDTARRTASAVVVAERALHQAEVAVQEERRRLALQLHDSVGAMLFAIGAGVRGLGDEPGLAPELRARLAEIEAQASEASATLRLSLQTLNASPQELALGVALRSDCRHFQERTGVPAPVVLLSALPALSSSATRALADSVREALLNVEKHARARSVVVTASSHQGGVLIVVADDGVGPPAEDVGGRGLGLQAITDRLARLGGCAALAANEDGGATLRLWLPC
jgi:LuxR family transcriptional regulator, regulator of acetate metabolism